MTRPRPSRRPARRSRLAANDRSSGAAAGSTPLARPPLPRTASACTAPATGSARASAAPPRSPGPIDAPWLERALRRVGVASAADLARLGPVETYRRVRALEPGVTLALLYALFAAQHGLRWHRLPEEAKRALRAQLTDAERTADERGMRGGAR